MRDNTLEYVRSDGNINAVDTSHSELRERPVIFDEADTSGTPECSACVSFFNSADLDHGEETLNILLIEDDKETSEYATNGLTQAGHVVNAVLDGKEGLVHCLDTDYDLMIVDRMLPGMDGLSLIKAARASGVKTPALFLTALSGVDDRVAGLEAGADDYLTKPFAFSELLARVNALGRRPAVSDETTSLDVGDLTMDLLKRTVRRGDVDIDLQPREFLLLEVLMRNEGRVVSRTMLLEKVWDFHFDPKTSVVETHISRLRSKIDKPFDVQLLHTSRNVGYSLHTPRS